MSVRAYRLYYSHFLLFTIYISLLSATRRSITHDHQGKGGAAGRRHDA